MKHLCPAFGALIALLMFASPMKAVLSSNRNKAIGVRVLCGAKGRAVSSGSQAAAAAAIPCTVNASSSAAGPLVPSPAMTASSEQAPALTAPALTATSTQQQAARVLPPAAKHSTGHQRAWPCSCRTPLCCCRSALTRVRCRCRSWPAADVQDLNPLPFVGMCANCTAWLLYGTLTHDFYVYFSNILGLMLAYFYIFTSLKFAPEKVCGAVVLAGGCQIQQLRPEGQTHKQQQAVPFAPDAATLALCFRTGALTHARPHVAPTHTPPQAQDRVRNIFLGFVVFFLIVGIVNMAAGLDYAGQKLLW